MSKKWYPVINYEECTDCEACFNKCSHGVFEIKNGRSVVVKPDNCVQGCHGCGNKCPVGAIEYIGENTDWNPPGKTGNPSEEGCSCDGDSCSDTKKDDGCCSGSDCCC